MKVIVTYLVVSKLLRGRRPFPLKMTSWIRKSIQVDQTEQLLHTNMESLGNQLKHS